MTAKAMSDDATKTIRGAIEGAGRAFQVVEGGKRGGNEPPGQEVSDDRLPCPITCLGHLDGSFHFLDARGQKRIIGARGLGNRHELLSLFLGIDTWLRQEFPKKAKVKRQENGEEIEVEVIVDFQINRAAAWLQIQCGDAGLYGEHVVLRAPGVWPGPDKLPVVHCGDEILIDRKWQKAGTRTGTQVWAAAAPVPRPGLPCEAAIARELQEDIKQLWNFRKAGAEIAVLGLLCCGYFGAAVNWRPAGFLLGGAGSGKSALLQVLRAASPMHHYSNDTSKAGVEASVNSRAMPILIDESSDRKDQSGAQALLDMVLAASGGEGTRGVRGSVEGHARTFQIAGSIIYSSISPPDMQPQHLGRFTMIEMRSPDLGADNTEEHRALTEKARHIGPRLWGRAIAGAERYTTALAMFRSALSNEGCPPREMDQIGALLAGWWILTEESNPTADDGRAGVRALEEFIRGAEETKADDGPRRMIMHMFTSHVQVQRSTLKRPLNALIERAFKKFHSFDPDKPDDFGIDAARTVLLDLGIRVIRADDTAVDRAGRSAPRMADGNGIWFATGAVELRALFRGTVWEGERWLYELKRFESARERKEKVRIGSYIGRGVWVGAEELGIEVEDG